MTSRILTGIVALVAGPATAALAAPGAREDNSGIFVWVFLGFCAAIVAAQLIPAILLALGGIKGLKKEKEATAHSAGH